MNAKQVGRCGAWIALASAVMLAAFAGVDRAAAGGPTAPVWSFVLSTAPGLPQDIWLTGKGNNTDGWTSGGVLCLGPLAQGGLVTQHATADADAIWGGVYGVDGTPVPPGTYMFPGGQAPGSGRTGPAEILGPRDYTITPGETFFLIFDVEIKESNIPFLPKGLVVKSMYTFDFDPTDPDEYGNTRRYVAAWVDFTGTGLFFVPFLNEGVLMTNIRLR